jgi:hypothetical protein
MLEEAKKLYHFIGVNLKRANIKIEGESPKKEMPVLEGPEMAILNNETKVLQALTRVVLNARVHSRNAEKFMAKLGLFNDSR